MVSAEFLAKSLKCAEEWFQKGNPSRAESILSSSATGFLAISLHQYERVADGVNWLVAQGVPALLERILSVNDLLVKGIDEGAIRPGSLSSSYHLMVFTHLGWLVGQFGPAEKFAQLARREDVVSETTPFCREYSRGVISLLRGEEFVPAKLKLRGLERYWNAYLPFMADVLRGLPLEARFAELDTMFANRNRDRRLTDDHDEIEGSGLDPVHWDFRKESFVRYCDWRDSRSCSER